MLNRYTVKSRIEGSNPSVSARTSSSSLYNSLNNCSNRSDAGLILRVLEPIWAVKPETARRVRGRMESILDWAKVAANREGENPARWRGHLQKALPARSR